METLIDEAIGDTQIIPDGENYWILPPSPPLVCASLASPDAATNDVKSEVPLAETLTLDPPGKARPETSAPSSNSLPRPGHDDAEALSPGATVSTEQTDQTKGTGAEPALKRVRPNLFEIDPPMKYRGVMNMVCVSAARRCTGEPVHI